MMDYTMTLDYTLAPGWMSPFIEGLIANQVVARACTECGYVSFPPTRLCMCGNAEGAWRTLSGTAQIILRTDGADGSFGLVQFDGATTQSVVAIENIDTGATQGRLVSGTGAVPHMVLGPIGGNKQS